MEKIFEIIVKTDSLTSNVDYLGILAKEVQLSLGEKDGRHISKRKCFKEQILQEAVIHLKSFDNKYNLFLTRESYPDTTTSTYVDRLFLVYFKLETDNLQQDLFGEIYKIKEKLICFLSEKFKKNIYIAYDKNNELICLDLYSKFYNLETKFRQILINYNLKRYKNLTIPNSLKGKILGYGKWYKDEKEFSLYKRINTMYCQVDFSSLAKLISINLSNIIMANEVSIVKKIDQIENQITGKKQLANIVDALKKLANNLETEDLYIEYEKYNDETRCTKEVVILLEVHKVPEYLVDEDLKSGGLAGLLGDKFKDCWENKLSQMRNMIAHNKPICYELYREILKIIYDVNLLFDAAMSYVSSYLDTMEDIENNRYEDIYEKK